MSTARTTESRVTATETMLRQCVLVLGEIERDATVLLAALVAGSVIASAQTGDFNGDAIFDCQDIDLLHEAIRTGVDNPLFDISGNGDATDLLSANILT